MTVLGGMLNLLWPRAGWHGYRRPSPKAHMLITPAAARCSIRFVSIQELDKQQVTSDERTAAYHLFGGGMHAIWVVAMPRTPTVS